MSKTGNLWAVVFDDPAAAERARAVVHALEDFNCLMIDDAVIITRRPDGSFENDRASNPVLAVTGGLGLGGVLAQLVEAQPFARASVGALVGGALTADGAGISDEFVREVEARMTPGASAVFLMDELGDQEAVLNELRDLGGEALKTNVDPGWAEEVLAALLKTSTPTAN